MVSIGGATNRRLDLRTYLAPDKVGSANVMPHAVSPGGLFEIEATMYTYTYIIITEHGPPYIGTSLFLP